MSRLTDEVRRWSLFIYLSVGGLLPLLLLVTARGVVAAPMGQSVGAPGSTAEKIQNSWIEETAEARVRDWVSTENARTLDTLTADQRYPQYFQLALAILDNTARSSGYDATNVSAFGSWVYRISQSAEHPRGLWERSRLSSYISGKPQWNTLLDVDALARKERKEWTLVPLVQFLPPSGVRCMLTLMRGGSERNVELREFDTGRGEFVEGGFVVPESRVFSIAVWIDSETMLVSTDFGPGSTGPTHEAGVVKRWIRGEKLQDAKQIYRGQVEQGEVASPWPEHGRAVGVVSANSRNEYAYWRLTSDFKLVRWNLPPKLAFGPYIFDGHIVFSPSENWIQNGRTWSAGEVLDLPVSDAVRADPRITLIIHRTYGLTVRQLEETKAGLVAYATDKVRGRVWTLTRAGGRWIQSNVPLPRNGTISPANLASPDRDITFATYESFLYPPTLYEIKVPSKSAQAIQVSPPQFDSKGLVTEQLFAVSSDGVEVPYFVVRPKKFLYNGDSATLVYGYGAFGISQVPKYSPVLGKLWLERGGVYVLGNVRGGSELGEEWHVTGKERQHTYDDFVAVIQDLQRRKISSPKKVGLEGGSAGGLLVGSTLVGRPDLVAAAVLKSPMLDPFRADLTHAGAEATEQEYGSSKTPAVRAFLQRTSPYEALEKGSSMPAPLILTSTTDSRVDPAQGRRFAYKLQLLNLPFLYYETKEGGHELAVTPEERAQIDALEFTYLSRALNRE